MAARRKLPREGRVGVPLDENAAGVKGAHARRIQRLLEVHAPVDEVEQDLRLPLRLRVGSQAAEGERERRVLSESPPRPFIIGSATPTTTAMASAASVALPPAFRTSRPTTAAIGVLAQAMPYLAKTGARLKRLMGDKARLFRHERVAKRALVPNR